MNTILLHVHDDAGQAARQQAALDLARRRDAHIDCLQTASFALYGGANMVGATAAFEAEVQGAMRVRRAAVTGRIADVRELMR